MNYKRKLNELQEGKVLLMTEDAAATIEMILGFPDDMDFLEMCRRLGFDKAKDFTYANLAATDFKDADLAGYDFTGADLRSCDFSRTKVEGMIYWGADIENAKWPPGFVPIAR
ncbi:pentapeptide repeat-containing protein [Pseudorhizobium sp. NPDC055634]